MGKVIKEYIVIDWGFTRLKFWNLNRNGEIIREKFIYIKNLNPNPEFYLTNSLLKIAQEINSFLGEIDNLTKEITILSSCQMHCLAGILESNEPFLSTWNDLPIKNEAKKILIKNGQPTLLSMPINKISEKGKDYYLSTKNIKKIFNKDEVKVKYFMTPFQLIYNNFLNLRTPPSIHFWESTCLPKNMISKNNNIENEYSDTFIFYKNNNFKNSANSIKIFPEIGDLQASTYSSLIIADIVINWGTGSQMIFKKSVNFSNDFYFRNFPNIGKVSVISHIPCGRIFSDYCQNTKYIYKDLIEAFDKVNIDTFNSYICEEYSLLYFPGYDTNKFKYLNQSYTTKEIIYKYSPEKLVCFWLNQYIKVLKGINLKEYYGDKSILEVKICGELGGMSIKAMNLIKKILSKNFSFSLSKTNVPLSLMRCMINSNI